MNYEDQSIQKFNSLRPVEFGILESFKLSRDIENDNCSDYNLELEMCKFPKKDSKILYLLFNGVRDVKIGRLEGIVNLLIEIRSLRGHQLEGLSFKVVENEYNAFSFYCADFNAMIIDKSNSKEIEL